MCSLVITERKVRCFDFAGHSVYCGNNCFKGYFYGKQEVMPNAVSQVAEQIAKLIAVFAIADLFAQGDMERKCLFAAIGMIIGEIANVLVVYLVFQFRKTRRTANASGQLLRKRDIGRSVVQISLPITANRLILSLLGTVEFLWIPQRLALYGLTNAEALAEYGRLNGSGSCYHFSVHADGCAGHSAGSGHCRGCRFEKDERR